jgi:chromosome segregation ATPase
MSFTEPPEEKHSIDKYRPSLNNSDCSNMGQERPFDQSNEERKRTVVSTINIESFMMPTHLASEPKDKSQQKVRIQPKEYTVVIKTHEETAGKSKLLDTDIRLASFGKSQSSSMKRLTGREGAAKPKGNAELELILRNEILEREGVEAENNSLKEQLKKTNEDRFYHTQKIQETITIVEEEQSRMKLLERENREFRAKVQELNMQINDLRMINEEAKENITFAIQSVREAKELEPLYEEAVRERDEARDTQTRLEHELKKTKEANDVLASDEAAIEGLFEAFVSRLSGILGISFHETEEASNDIVEKVLGLVSLSRRVKDESEKADSAQKGLERSVEKLQKEVRVKDQQINGLIQQLAQM